MEAKCAILLALISCIGIVCIEGRPLFPKNKDSINTIEANHKRELGEQVSQPAPPHHIASPTTPHSTAHNFGDISGTHAAYKDDFRPTTPGSSPGVGHAFTNSGEYMESEAEHDVTAGKPTAPGHSPGVGHVLQVQNAEPIP
ncbi:hypothetical protein C1H46_032977 [Malus baccata]|uniref:Uncharacterized protein n=1 Tax=Malus baccata TaxID=106549 RepID=A0A540L4S7_MALBA|nr:hypothetical protein C1H46_032977 [Malus baccata]